MKCNHGVIKHDKQNERCICDVGFGGPKCDTFQYSDQIRKLVQAIFLFYALVFIVFFCYELVQLITDIVKEIKRRKIEKVTLDIKERLKVIFWRTFQVKKNVIHLLLSLVFILVSIYLFEDPLHLKENDNRRRNIVEAIYYIAVYCQTCILFILQQMFQKIYQDMLMASKQEQKPIQTMDHSDDIQRCKQLLGQNEQKLQKQKNDQLLMSLEQLFAQLEDEENKVYVTRQSILHLSQNKKSIDTSKPKYHSMSGCYNVQIKESSSMKRSKELIMTYKEIINFVIHTLFSLVYFISSDQIAQAKDHDAYILSVYVSIISLVLLQINILITYIMLVIYILMINSIIRTRKRDNMDQLSNAQKKQTIIMANSLRTNRFSLVPENISNNKYNQNNQSISIDYENQDQNKIKQQEKQSLFKSIYIDEDKINEQADENNDKQGHSQIELDVHGDLEKEVDSPNLRMVDQYDIMEDLNNCLDDVDSQQDQVNIQQSQINDQQIDIDSYHDDSSSQSSSSSSIDNYNNWHYETLQRKYINGLLYKQRNHQYKQIQKSAARETQKDNNNVISDEDEQMTNDVIFKTFLNNDKIIEQDIQVGRKIAQNSLVILLFIFMIQTLSYTLGKTVQVLAYEKYNSLLLRMCILVNWLTGIIVIWFCLRQLINDFRPKQQQNLDWIKHLSTQSYDKIRFCFKFPKFMTSSNNNAINSKRYREFEMQINNLDQYNKK